MRKHSENRLRK